MARSVSDSDHGDGVNKKKIAILCKFIDLKTPQRIPKFVNLTNYNMDILQIQLVYNKTRLIFISTLNIRNNLGGV